MECGTDFSNTLEFNDENEAGMAFEYSDAECPECGGIAKAKSMELLESEKINESLMTTTTVDNIDQESWDILKILRLTEAKDGNTIPRMEQMVMTFMLKCM